MRKWMVVLLIAVLLFCFSSVVVADDLKVGIFNFPPFYTVEKGKEPGGTLLEMVTTVLKWTCMNTFQWNLTRVQQVGMIWLSYSSVQILFIWWLIRHTSGISHLHLV